jgi:hypothetical protein
MAILGNRRSMEKAIDNLGGYIKESEIPKGMVIIIREELLRRTKETMEKPHTRSYNYCKIRLARGGMT